MDFIPVENYSYYFYQFLLIVVVVVFIQSISYEIDDPKNLNTKKIIGSIILVLVTLYMGFRPVSNFFGDMVIYNRSYESYQNGEIPVITKDILFEYFLFYSSKFVSANFFFFLCAILYIIPLLIACKNFFKEYWFYGFFILIISFSFWGYGVNGIRNGIATSLFIYGISLSKKQHIYAFFLISFFIHKSLMLPIAAYFFTSIYSDPKKYLYLWLLAIPISFVAGSFFSTLLFGSGLVEEDRLSGYFEEFDIDSTGGVEMKIGFRWDFILYSASGVFVGYYFIIKKKFKDVFYSSIFNIYLFSNAIWILVIRANFSNRFAYLSWFLLGLVVIYPFLKFKFFKNHHAMIGKTLLIYFIFTYLFNVILAT